MAQKTRKNPYASQDKYLIAEQPGMTVLMIGIVLALCLGLVARAFIAPDRVKGLITRAAQNINKDIHVEFEDAEVSLSDGLLPRFAVVITQIRMESDQECWMRPRLEIDQMRLPVSLIGLISGSGIVREIQTDNVKLTLRGEYKNCRDLSSLPPAKPSESSPVKLVSLQESSDSGGGGKYNNMIQRVLMGKLQVELEKYPQYHAEFQEVDFRAKSFEPRWFSLDAKTHLFRDEQVGDYLAHANIHVEYKDSPEPSVEAHFFGNWREGHYSVIGNFSPRDHNLTLETELKHIPFSQILALMQKYHFADPTLNARELWLSFHSHLSGDPEKLARTPVDISSLKLEGDQLELDSEKIHFRSLDPLAYDPIQLNVQRLDVDKVLSFFNRSLGTKIFSHMGSFSGQAEIRSGQDIYLNGLYSGLEFIFANRGQREVQTIDRMQAEASFHDEKWKIHLSKIEPNQGSFKGDMQVSANKNFSDMNVNLNVEEATLAPAVQQLMTQGGEIGAMSTQLDLDLRAGHIANIKGHLNTPKIHINGVEMDQAKTKLNFSHGEVLMDVSVDHLALRNNSDALHELGSVFKTLTTDRGVEMSKLTGQFRTQEFKTLVWKNFTAQLATGQKISTSGDWNEAAQLHGQVLVKDKKAQKKWKVEGTRSQPIMNEEAAAK